MTFTVDRRLKSGRQLSPFLYNVVKNALNWFLAKPHSLNRPLMFKRF